MRLHAQRLGILGFISALISFYTLPDVVTSTGEFDFTFYIVGLIYAAVLSFHLIKLQQKTPKLILKMLFWLGMSQLAYYTAVQVFFLTLDLGKYPPLLLAGSVGALLVLMGFYSLFRFPKVLDIVMVSIIGGVLGLCFLINQGSDNTDLLTLFIVWQTGIALYLGHILDRQFSNHLLLNT